jgi:hypothetical protein
MKQDDFTKMMEQAYKQALAQADIITANAEQVRKEVEKELDAAREARRTAEQEGERMADEFYEGKRKEFAEFYRTELLRNLARLHIETGKDNHIISLWLNVEQRFVQNIRDVVERVKKYSTDAPKRTPLEGSPQIYISQDRDGTHISFSSLEGYFTAWVEFGTGESILIGVPNPDKWEERTGIPSDRRERVLTFVAEYLIDVKMDGKGSFLIGVDVVTVFRE